MTKILLQWEQGDYSIELLNHGWGAKEISLEVWVKNEGGRQHMPNSWRIYDNWFGREKSALRVVENFKTLIASTIITGISDLDRGDFKQAAYQHRKHWRAK